ncbi:hypothetical protein [Streptomyces sp. bgisy084]|uniref:hypothetical protein n=1 Tax=unclassified Streptomyces TaxID=2593676 RepID=UPI003D764E63
MPTSELTFRTALDTDVPGLVDLIDSAYRGDISRGGWTTEADLLEGQRTDPAGVTAGERTPFPYGDERIGVPQRPDLEFELLVKPLGQDMSA